MSGIEEIQQEIIEAFSLLEDWMDKYEQIIEEAKGLPPMDEEQKTEENMIRGCQSRVWLRSSFKGGKVYFDADSDAIITRGLIALLVRVYNGRRPEDIVGTEPHFIEAIGLKEHLSPTRSNGLLAMIKQIKLEALAYQVKQGKNDQRAN